MEHEVGSNHFALLHLSCALLLKERKDYVDSSRSGRFGVQSSEISDRAATLGWWFAPPDATFKCRTLSEVTGASLHKPVSWLHDLIRHDAYDVPRYRGYEGASPGRDIPNLFVGARTPTYSNPAKPWSRIPAQRPEVGSRHESGLPQISELDHNDFLVTSDERRGLRESQLFLCFLFAQRRSAIFAAGLRERIYNVWLPPAVLSPCEDDGVSRPIVVFPFVSLTRQPNSEAWRFVFTLNMVIAPTASESGAYHREMPDAELGMLVGSLDGPSMSPQHRVYPSPEYRTVGDVWPSYASHLLGAEPACTYPPTSAPVGTLRNWIELFLFAVARRQLTGTSSILIAKRSDLDDQHLADDVTHSIRMTTCWSVMLDVPGVAPIARGASPTGDTAWQPDDDIVSHMKCFDHLGVGVAGSFRPTDEDRIDVGRVGEPSWLSWALPIRRCLVTFSLSDDEDYPANSRLNLFAVLGHMVIGLMSARGILLSLVHDVELPHEPRAATIRRREFAVELEEMTDIDAAWTLYSKLYQRLSKLRGLEEMYRNVRERAEFLATHDKTLDDIESESRRNALSWAAAVLAATLIIMTVWLVTRGRIGAAIVSATLVALAIVIGSWSLWRPWRQRTRMRVRKWSRQL